MKNKLSIFLEKIEYSQVESLTSEFLSLNDSFSEKFLGGRKTENGTCIGGSNDTCSNTTCPDSKNWSCTNGACIV